MQQIGQIILTFIKVQVNCHITYQKNWYSVPYEYVGKSVDLKVSETTLTIYYQNKRINIHKLFPAYIKNKYSTYEQDMPDIKVKIRLPKLLQISGYTLH